MGFTPSSTVAEVRKYLEENAREGVTCPCCNQFVKVYKRKITSSQCLALINLYKLSAVEDRFYHLTEFRKGVADTGSNDFSKLKFYGFIDKKELSESERLKGAKRASGYYRINDLGKRFVECKSTVKEYMFIFDDHFKGFAGKEISIIEALNNKFNYKELMNS